MKILKGKKEQEAILYMNKAAEIAKNAKCYRSKCGAVIVKNKRIIGAGYNSPLETSGLKNASRRICQRILFLTKLAAFMLKTGQ